MKVNTELAKKLLKTMYFVNGDGGIRTQNVLKVNDLAFLMESYHQEQLSLTDVVGRSEQLCECGGEKKPESSRCDHCLEKLFWGDL